jgi:FMN-dependent oxidoreductase (nitrilotriacetate monooxygenase family)
MHFVTQMCLGPTNHHNGGWRHPEGDSHRVLEASRYEDIARICERGLFDGVFVVDTQFVPGLSESAPSALLKDAPAFSMLDPMQILALMARATKHIGITGTMSTSFNHPYHIARAFGTLDHLSGGRAGWNIVTSTTQAEAQNYGLENLPERDARYDFADEVVEACVALWNTWEPGALRIDKKSGVFADPEKVHYVKYAGSKIRTQGGLATPHSPQGHPVFMQAGSSARGCEFAARWAEVIFTTQSEKPVMQKFYAEMKDRVRAQGRQPEHCVILPSIDVIVGETDSEARERADYVDSFASMEQGLRTCGIVLGMDLSKYPMDMPLTELPVDKSKVAAMGFYQNFLSKRKADGSGLNLGELALLWATTWMNPRLVGTPAMIADQMVDLFEAEACDGFVIGTSTSPMGVQNFVDLVVPELQRRGVYRNAYTGKTFRDHLRSTD